MRKRHLAVTIINTQNVHDILNLNRKGISVSPQDIILASFLPQNGAPIVRYLQEVYPGSAVSFADLSIYFEMYNCLFTLDPAVLNELKEGFMNAYLSTHFTKENFISLFNKCVKMNSPIFLNVLKKYPRYHLDFFDIFYYNYVNYYIKDLDSRVEFYQLINCYKTKGISPSTFTDLDRLEELLIDMSIDELSIIDIMDLTRHLYRVK